MGGLDSPTTNQRLYKIDRDSGYFKNLTELFENEAKDTRTDMLEEKRVELNRMLIITKQE